MKKNKLIVEMPSMICKMPSSTWFKCGSLFGNIFAGGGIMDLFGDCLRDMRKKANLTQMEAASEIGVSRNAIQDWERGVYAPEEEKISRISRVYNVPKGDILRKLSSCKKKKERTIYNWPDFLFDENTNEIVKRLHLNLEQQELFGQLYMVGAITLEKKIF